MSDYERRRRQSELPERREEVPGETSEPPYGDEPATYPGPDLEDTPPEPDSGDGDQADA